MMKETPYKLLKDNKKKKLDKNNKAKMTLYNALPRKEYERVFVCKTAKDVWHTLIITYQGSSQVKNCKIDLLPQEYKKFTISNEESIDSGFTRFNAIVTSLKSLDPDYSSKNHQVMMLLLNPSKKVMPIALKANVTRVQTSNNSVCQDGSDENEEEEINSIVKNLWKLFKKGNRFERENCFGNGDDRIDRGQRSQGVGSSRGKHNSYSCGSKNHFLMIL
nr:UBN2 domain-containing protein [Tanacetum cinerariifolium]